MAGSPYAGTAGLWHKESFLLSLGCPRCHCILIPGVPTPTFCGGSPWLLPLRASSVRAAPRCCGHRCGKHHVYNKRHMPFWNNSLVLKGHTGGAGTISKQKLRGLDSWASVTNFPPSPCQPHSSLQSSFFFTGL